MECKTKPGDDEPEGKCAMPDSGTIVQHVAVRRLSGNGQSHWSIGVDAPVTR
jgi:hypothetical protein